MKLLIVESSSIFFGCIKARDVAGNAATVILYENMHIRYVDIVPFSGDLLLCYSIHASVYRPFCRVVWGSLYLRRLPIPHDVMHYYFPLFERLKFSVVA